MLPWVPGKYISASLIETEMPKAYLGERKEKEKKENSTWFSAGVVKGKTVPTQFNGKDIGRWRWSNLSPMMVP